MADGCCTPDARRNGNAVPGYRSPGAAAERRGPRSTVRTTTAVPCASCRRPPSSWGPTAGDGFPADGEGPVREVSLSGFAIDLCAVSNDDFAAFVEDSGYVTEAEHYGWSFVFKNHVPKSAFKKRLVRTVPGLGDGGTRWTAPAGSARKGRAPTSGSAATTR